MAGAPSQLPLQRKCMRVAVLRTKSEPANARRKDFKTIGEGKRLSTFAASTKMFAKLLKARCASDPVHLPNYAQMEATKKLHWARNKGSIQAQAWRGRLHCIFKACSRTQSSVLKSRPFLRLPTPFCEPAIVDAIGTVRTFFFQSTASETVTVP